MLVFDQLKKDDSQLRFLAVVVAGGLGVLFIGLWWVQVVSGNYYQDKLETQSIRTVRLPAVRGNILDRDSRPLAENRPSYNINLYLEDLSPKFQAAYSAAVGRVRTNVAALKEAEKRKLKPHLSWWQWWQKRQLEKKLSRQFPVTPAMKDAVARQTRFEVSSNIVADLGARLQVPVPFDVKTFQKSYSQARALPMPILANLTPPQVARFEEQSMHTPGMDLDIQALRYYPHGFLAFHVLGFLTSNRDSKEGEQSEYSYRMNDYSGVVGIEWRYDKYLSGSAGSKSVLVDNLGYRRSETVVSPAEPGNNVVLTIDMDIQMAAERALQLQMANIRGAVVVMNATNGDILAMASAPTFDPNYTVSHPDPATWAVESARFNDVELKVQHNRATYENYHPGSVFKIVVALAGLELGTLHPDEIFHNDHVDPANGLAYYPVGNTKKHDTAPPGNYNLNRALALSCNSYFIYNGLKPGVLPKIVELGQRLHLGERTGLIPRQETDGSFPTPRQIASHWRDGDTANLCIGQGYIDVTPLQICVLGAAVANGGKVLYPRLVSRIESFDGSQVLETFPEGRVRDNLGVSERSFKLVREAMLKDVVSLEGSGHAIYNPDFLIAGKTGTAQVERNGRIEKSEGNTWFLSFGPYEKPGYVVVVMVEGGASGGKTCVPIAKRIYRPSSPANSNGRKNPRPATTPWPRCAEPMFPNAINAPRQSRADVLQIGAVLFLMAISVVFVYSATMSYESTNLLAWYRQSYFKQIVWFGIGLGAAGLVCFVDYHTLARWSLVGYWFTMLLLVAVLVIGVVNYGARRWIGLGPFQFQPSEFAKLAFILAQANFLSRPAEELRQPRLFWQSIGMMMLPFLLILKEPDLGSALVLVPTSLAMLFAAGTPKRYLLQLLTIGGVAAALFVVDIMFAPPGWQIKMQEYQRKRLLVYFGRDYADFAPPGASAAERKKLAEEEAKDSYNIRQSLISVGSGGMFGKGWREGEQNALGYLPQAGKHNDFIFSVIAEEAGFLGSVVVLTLYALILFTGIRIAGQARDRLGKLLAVGVVTLIFSHVFINIGMNIRIMPVAGVPLPLLSYGGSSVLGSLIAMGLLQNVHIYRKAY